jgi:hypothetical protein
MDTDGLTPLALTNGAAPNAAWNQRGMWTKCDFKTGSDCRGEQAISFLHLNQSSLPQPDISGGFGRF